MKDWLRLLRLKRPVRGNGLKSQSNALNAGSKRPFPFTRLKVAPFTAAPVFLPETRLQQATPPTPSFSSLLQVIGNVSYDYTLLEQQRAFEHQRTLIVQQVLPPFRRDKLRHNNRHNIILMFSFDAVDEV
jgi:hypothetical protein